jgi:hypothetical protein
VSSPDVIGEVSDLLQAVLKEGLTTVNDPNPTVELTNPADEAADKTLSIWLYQVMANPHLRNAPTVRTSTEADRLPPLALDLLYLLTPLQKNEKANQQTLGRAMRVLYDNAILVLSSGGDVEEVHLSICQRSIEELAEVWEALQKPYRLSVCFEVRTVQIDSERLTGAGRVRERGARFDEQTPEASA